MLAYENINYEKSIHKAINNPGMEVKEKHVRLVIMGTFSENGARMFWRVVLGFPCTTSKPIAWKLCYVLHKLLREGHSLCCGHSQSHKIYLERIRQAWLHSDKYFAKIIQMYSKLLVAKLEFHCHHPEFPGHLNASLSELQLIVKNNMNDYFQLSVDILEYLNNVLQFQEAVFEAPLHTVSQRKDWKYILAPLALSIQESSQLYNHCVRILFILHSSLPTEALQGHRIRFGDQFRRLKAVYSNANICEMVSVPSLPEKQPNFFIEADLPPHITLESSRLSSVNLVDMTPTDLYQNIRTQQIMIPKSNNAVVVNDLIDLSDSPPFSQQKPIEPLCFLPAPHQVRIENMATQIATAPILTQKDLNDPFDTSFLEIILQSTAKPPLSPVIHQMHLENMIAQQPKARENSFRPSSHTLLSPPSHQIQPEARSAGENSYNGYANIPPPKQMTNALPQRSHSMEGHFSNQFEYNGNYRPSAPPLFIPVADRQIHVEAIIERDNRIQYLQHELEKLRHENYRMESDNFKKFQEKIISLEKSLFVKEIEALQRSQTKMLINEVSSSPQHHSVRSSFSVPEHNPNNFYENIEGGQSTIGDLKIQDEQISSDSDWDNEDEIDEVQNGIKNMELEDNIRDIKQQIDLHMENKDLEVWKNNRELFNIKTEILKMNLENLIKENQADIAEPEEKAKKGNLVNRKFKKVTSFLKEKKMKLKG